MIDGPNQYLNSFKPIFNSFLQCFHLSDLYQHILIWYNAVQFYGFCMCFLLASSAIKCIHFKILGSLLPMDLERSGLLYSWYQSILQKPSYQIHLLSSLPILSKLCTEGHPIVDCILFRRVLAMSLPVKTVWYNATIKWWQGIAINCSSFDHSVQSRVNTATMKNFNLCANQSYCNCYHDWSRHQRALLSIVKVTTFALMTDLMIESSFTLALCPLPFVFIMVCIILSALLIWQFLHWKYFLFS